MKVNGPGLNVAVESPVPLQAAEEILVEDVSGGVFIAENLSRNNKDSFFIFFCYEYKGEEQALLL